MTSTSIIVFALFALILILHVVDAAKEVAVAKAKGSDCPGCAPGRFDHLCDQGHRLEGRIEKLERR